MVDLSAIYSIDSEQRFAEYSKIYLGNVNYCGTTEYGPFETDFLYPKEQRQSLLACQNRTTDYSIDDVKYKVNRYGFRGQWDLNKISSDSIAVFGCSITFGVGCHDNDVWPSVLENKLERDVYNFGVRTTGIEHCALLFSIVSRFAKFKTVIVLLPQFTRLLIPKMECGELHIDTVMQSMPSPNTRIEASRQAIYSAVDEVYLEYKALSAIDSMISTANASRTDLYLSSWCQKTHSILASAFSNRTNILPLFNVNNGPRARDGSHPGKLANQEFALKCAEIIGSNNN